MSTFPVDLDNIVDIYIYLKIWQGGSGFVTFFLNIFLLYTQKPQYLISRPKQNFGSLSEHA